MRDVSRHQDEYLPQLSIGKPFNTKLLLGKYSGTGLPAADAPRSSLLSGHNIDSDRAIWLLGLAVVLLAISRIAEMGNKTGS